MTVSIDFLRSLPHFTTLDDEVLQRIGEGVVELSFASNEICLYARDCLPEPRPLVSQINDSLEGDEHLN